MSSDNRKEKLRGSAADACAGLGVTIARTVAAVAHAAEACIWNCLSGPLGPASAAINAFEQALQSDCRPFVISEAITALPSSTAICAKAHTLTLLQH